MSLSRAEEDYNGLEIAVIGMAGRFPGADSVDALWENVKRGVESVRAFTDEELQAAGVVDEVRNHPRFVGVGATIEDIDKFDAGLFGYSPREAALMDPQQRLFLHCAHEALENSGCNPETHPGAIGVYASTAMNTYLMNSAVGLNQLMVSEGGFQLLASSDKDFLATRVAYKLGLRGPAVVVQSACSSSLVAVHLACQALLSGECDMALAGGVSLFVPQKCGYIYNDGEILSPDGRCRAFDVNAAGTAVGNGVAAVALKRLDDAMRDRDSIHAVIRGSAINNDGSVKMSYTAPSVDGQTSVIRMAQAAARVEPETIGYLETHGTGTKLGDPIEVAALTKAFRVSTDRTRFCAIGSIKSNIGHLNTAAGVAGFIKAALAVKHGTIPPSINFVEPNPAIDFASSPFFVAESCSKWPKEFAKRRAGVSSFGLGGTNAHIIVEAPPEPPLRTPCDRASHLLVLSANTANALESATDRLVDYLADASCAELSDVSHSLLAGRRRLEHRRAVVVRNACDAVEVLRARDVRFVRSRREARADRRLGFLFPGQGSQHVGMAANFYTLVPAFRAEFDTCAKKARELGGLDLHRLIGGSSPFSDVDVQQTQIAQPALFVVEYCLGRVWTSFGVRPGFLIGHSIGELAAACLSGVMSIDDALKMVIKRGELMQNAAPGAMLAVALTPEDLNPLLNEHMEVAVVNAVDMVVVSGEEEAIQSLRGTLEARGVSCSQLHVSHAFHSKMMSGAANALAKQLGAISLSPPRIPIISTVTGTWLTDAQAIDPQHWIEQIRRPVLFHDALTTALSCDAPMLLEVGPSDVLTRLVRNSRHSDVCHSLAARGQNQDDWTSFISALGDLWLAGVNFDRERLGTETNARRTPVPTYPFEGKRYWLGEARPQKPCNMDAPLEPPKAELATTRPAHSRPDLAVEYLAPATATQSQVATVWGSILGISPIGVHDDFYALGGHSLLAVRVVSMLRDATQLHLPVDLLRHASTIAEMALAIDEYRAGSTVHTTIEPSPLLNDVLLPPDVACSSPPTTKKLNNALISGASGFLGAFLLGELLRQTDGMVHCLIRAKSEADASTRLESNLRKYDLWESGWAERVIAIAADLEQPRIGLSPKAYEVLANTIDAVYHAGACVNFTLPYRQLKLANVNGTIEMLRFAVAGRPKVVHYISTAAVLPSTGGTFREDDVLHEPSSLHTGYAESKWVADRLVAKAVTRGLTCNIYRPAVVTGDTRTGHANVSDMATCLLKGCIQLGCAPRLAGSIYALPVDFVGRAIIQLSLPGRPINCVYHLTPDAPLPASALFHEAARFGYPLVSLPLVEWRDVLERAATRPENNALYPFLGLMGDGFDAPMARLDNTNTRSQLREHGLTIPSIDGDLIRQYLQHWVDTGFLPAPSRLQQQCATLERA